MMINEEKLSNKRKGQVFTGLIESKDFEAAKEWFAKIDFTENSPNLGEAVEMLAYAAIENVEAEEMLFTLFSKTDDVKPLTQASSFYWRTTRYSRDKDADLGPALIVALLSGNYRVAEEIARQHSFAVESPIERTETKELVESTPTLLKKAIEQLGDAWEKKTPLSAALEMGAAETAERLSVRKEWSNTVAYELTTDIERSTSSEEKMPKMWLPSIWEKSSGGCERITKGFLSTDKSKEKALSEKVGMAIWLTNPRFWQEVSSKIEDQLRYKMLVNPGLLVELTKKASPQVVDNFFEMIERSPEIIEKVSPKCGEIGSGERSGRYALALFGPRAISEKMWSEMQTKKSEEAANIYAFSKDIRKLSKEASASEDRHDFFLRVLNQIGPEEVMAPSRYSDRETLFMKIAESASPLLFEKTIAWLEKNLGHSVLTKKLETETWILEAQGMKKKGDVFALLIGVGSSEKAEFLIGKFPHLNQKRAKETLKYLKEKNPEMMQVAISSFERLLLSKAAKTEMKENVRARKRI